LEPAAAVEAVMADVVAARSAGDNELPVAVFEYVQAEAAVVAGVDVEGFAGGEDKQQAEGKVGRLVDSENAHVEIVVWPVDGRIAALTGLVGGSVAWFESASLPRPLPKSLPFCL